MQFNEHILDLPQSSLSVEKRIEQFLRRDPSKTLIRLDQELMNMPLPETVVAGMKQAVDEISAPYGAQLSCPWSGYDSLKTAVANRYRSFGAEISEQEIFVTSGTESALSCLFSLFTSENTVLLPDPGPVSLSRLQLCAGRTLSFARAVPENRFVPMPGKTEADLILLASPNPVTGVAMTRKELTQWVDFANRNDSLIVFDSSLTAYTGEKDLHSIYEIPGAKDCAIELFSFEVGFGVRELKIATVILPRSLTRGEIRPHALFSLRQPFTATPPGYVMQKAAEIILSPEAKADTDKIIYRIQKVARTLAEGLTAAGLAHVGSESSPYLWVQCPRSMSAWQCFDLLLEKAHCVVTPGSLFGYGGERFIRITSFGLPEEAKEAVARIGAVLGRTPKEEAPPSDPLKTLFGQKD